MAQVITVTSQKGGVAKTTTAVSIATGLGIGFPTLLADFDPQGHASIALGIDPAPGIHNAFIDQADDAICETDKHVRLLPGNSRTRTTETIFRSEWMLDQIVQRFNALANGFDFVVIDTPPGGLLQELAIRLADILIIPARCEQLGLDGLAATLEVAKRIGKPDRRYYILPTMFDKRLNEHRYNLGLLKRNYPAHMADPVPARVAVAEASACGRTIWECNGAMEDVQAAYTGLLDRIHGLDRIQGVK